MKTSIKWFHESNMRKNFTFGLTERRLMPILLICEAVESWRDRGINYFSSKRTREEYASSETGQGAGTTSFFLSLLVAQTTPVTYWEKMFKLRFYHSRCTFSSHLYIYLSASNVNKNHHVATMRPPSLVLLYLWWWNLIKLNKVRSMNQKQLSFNQIIYKLPFF